MVVPTINYNWPSLPGDLTKDDFRKSLTQWALRAARYTPGLVRWWLTQKNFRSSSVLDKNPRFFSTKDLEVLKNTPGYQLLSKVTLLSACTKRKKQIGVLCISLSSGMFLHNRRWIGNFFGEQLSKIVSGRFLESCAHFRKHLCCMDPSFWQKYPH